MRIRVVLALVISACSSSPPATLLSSDAPVAPSPVGDVGGLVLDVATQQPLPDVAVTVIDGAKSTTATTIADGTFHVTGVGTGNVIVTFAAPGYLGATATATVPVTADGTAPESAETTVGPIGLIKSSGTFTMRLLDENGAPAAGATVTLRAQLQFVSYATGSPIPMGNVNASATSDAAGIATVAGLPDYTELGELFDPTLFVYVPPQSVGAPAYPFLGLHVVFPTAGTSGEPTIVLAGPTTPLSILASNLAYVSAPFTDAPNPIDAAGPITIAFNQAIDPATVVAQVLQEDGKTLAAQQVTSQVDANVLTLNGAFPAGARFNLSFHVESIAHPPSLLHTVDLVRPFFTMPAGPPSIVAASVVKTTSAGVVSVSFSFDQPVGVGDDITSASDCVAQYEGVNLDNGDPAIYAGEYSPLSVTCDADANPAPVLNITALTPGEQAPPVLTTGFATRWTVVINDTPAPGTNSAACKPGIPAGACPGPIGGNELHLVFSRLPPTAQIVSTTGVPLTDSAGLVLTIP